MRTFRAAGTLSAGVLALLLVSGCHFFQVNKVDVRELTRAEYKLTPSTAAKVSAFLLEHVAAELETKVYGDTLEVTTPAKVQRIIGDFISLIDVSSNEVQTSPVPSTPSTTIVPPTPTTN